MSKNMAKSNMNLVRYCPFTMSSHFVIALSHPWGLPLPFGRMSMIHMRSVARVSRVASKDWHMRVTVEEVATLFNTGIDTMQHTLEATTQFGIQMAVHLMMRWLCMDHLNLHQPRLPEMWFLDTLQVKVKSKWGNMCANVYTQGKFTKVIPMTLRKDARKSLVEFTDNIGIPDTLITDGATEFTGKNTNFVQESLMYAFSSTH